MKEHKQAGLRGIELRLTERKLGRKMTQAEKKALREIVKAGKFDWSEWIK
jgi:hypothetical protein